MLQAESEGTRIMLGSLFAQRWVLGPQGQQGITWIECLVLFFLSGGTHKHIGMPDTFDCENKASLRQLLQNLTKRMRCIIHMYMPNESQQFFVPSKAAHLSFQSIGYTNYVAAMAGNISGLSGEQKQIVAKTLIGLRHTFTRNSSILFHQGNLKLKGLKFSFRESLDIVYNSRFARLDRLVSLAHDLKMKPNANT